MLQFVCHQLINGKCNWKNILDHNGRERCICQVSKSNLLTSEVDCFISLPIAQYTTCANLQQNWLHHFQNMCSQD